MGSAFPIPLNAIRAIEIVARRGSLAPAAEELGVTPGAVSQHIRRAEERLGRELFERTPRGLVPSPALRDILPQLSAGFVALADGLAALRGSDEHTLTLTMGNVFASRWLVWRLGRFSARNPGIEVKMVVTGRVLDLTRSDIDCAIRFGRGDWPDAEAELIGGERYTPVCAPVLAAAIHAPADLSRVPVIHDTSTMLSWDAWWAAAGQPPSPVSGPTFDDPALAFDAAISGQGVLLAVDMMSADAVSDGRLARPLPISATSGVGYWFVTAKGRREPDKTRRFREWLRQEVPASTHGYVQQLRG